MEPKYRTLIQAAVIATLLVVLAWAYESPQQSINYGPQTVVDASSPH